MNGYDIYCCNDKYIIDRNSVTYVIQETVCNHVGLIATVHQLVQEPAAIIFVSFRHCFVTICCGQSVIVSLFVN